MLNIIYLGGHMKWSHAFILGTEVGQRPCIDASLLWTRSRWDRDDGIYTYLPSLMTNVELSSFPSCLMT